MTIAEPATGTRIILEPAAEAIVFLGAEQPPAVIAVGEVVLHEGEVLASVELATVCGSDVHTVQGHRSAATPQVLGHEQVGRVVGLGPGAPARTVDGTPLQLGDRIVWGVCVACGACDRCERGLSNKCENVRKYGHEQVRRGWELTGGLATHAHLLPRTAIVRVPERLPADVLAPASCATATVAAVVAAAVAVRSLVGETVLVSGCGMLGLTAVAMAREAGAKVVAVDPDPKRRALAREFGADEAFSPARMHRDFSIAFELSGSGEAVAQAVDKVDVGGVVVLAGSVFPAPPVPLSAEGIVRRLVTIVGVHNYLPEHLVQAVQFLRRIDQRLFGRLVASPISLQDAVAALPTMTGSAVRVGVRPR